MANRIKGITVEIDGSTTGLDKALRNVNTTIRSTQTQLKDVQKLLKLDPSNTELLSQKQRLLKEAISATKDKLDSLKQAQEQAKQQLENGTLGQDKYDALQREIEETEQALKQLESQVSTTYAKLEKIDETGKKWQETGNKIASVGKDLTTKVTLPIVGLGAAAIKTTADFDAQMSKVQAISGATGDDFDDLRDKAREMGAKTKFSATEAGEAMEYMGMAGWKTGDMIDGLDGIMNLAAASGEDLGTTSDIVTDALTAFGLSAKDSGHFADVLAAASTNANTNVSMLGESFKYAAPVAGSLGISAEDTSIALGLMANSGIKASQAGTALRTGLTNLAKPTKQMPAYFTSQLNNNKCFVETGDSRAASGWYFELVGENVNNQYYIYTYIDGEKKYVTNPSGNFVGFSDKAGTVFELSQAAEGLFYLRKLNQNLWLQHSNGGGGIRFYTDNNNAVNTRITLTYASSFNLEKDPNGLDGRTYGIAFNDFSIREVSVKDESVIQDQTAGDVSDNIIPLKEGETLTLGGTPAGGSYQTGYSYKVSYTLLISNTAGMELPATGGSGYGLWYLFGGALICWPACGQVCG